MFKFKGKSPKEFGLIVEEPENLLRKAQMRYEEIQIEGRNGSLFNELGYSVVEVDLSMYLMKPDRLDDVFGWFNGVGLLEYNGRFTKARIYAEVAPVRTSGIKLITFQIIRNPIWFSSENEFYQPWGVNFIKNGWNDFELSGNKENLIKQGWESFEPYGNKPNLIPNGWESFVPYGSGEVLFKSDFTEQWRVQLVSGAEGSHGNGVINKTNDIGIYDMWYNIGDIKAPVFITVEIKTKGDKDFRFGFGGVGGSSREVVLKGDNKFHTYEFSADNIGNGNILMGAISEGKYELRNLQLSDNNNRHLVVEKTPLDNGLTRIQTWGGNNNIKLLKSIGTGHVGKLSLSTYVKPNNTNGRIYFQGVGIGNNIDIEKHLVITGVVDTNANAQFRVVTHNVNSNLDFIASDPQIVEGDKPNMAYSIQELDDDLYRIRTWGGDHDMKLKSPNFGQLAETGTDMTISLYVENNSDSMIRFSNNLAIGGVPYPDGVEYMITVPREYKGYAYLKGELVDRDVELDIRSDGNIDMIVSQPEIIEGHDLNSTLHMEELENNRTKIEIVSPDKNAKLTWKGDAPIDNYTTSLSIKNTSESNIKVDAMNDVSGYIESNEEKEVVLSGYGEPVVVVSGDSERFSFVASDPIIVDGEESPTWEVDEYPRIINKGTVNSQPLIKLTKGTTTTCEYEVNGIYFKYHFNTDDHVIIDCEEMEVTYNGMPRNRHLTIGFEFPRLKTGDNVVKQISGDATIEFTRKDAWL